MKRLIFALAMFAAAPAWAGTTPCTTSSFAGGETVTSAFLNNCTWLGEQFTAEGSTADGNEATIGFVDPTADFTINFPDLAAATTDVLVTLAASQTLSNKSLASVNLTLKTDFNNSAVDDDDCTGEQGKAWYDTTDSAFEFCNANTGAPATVAATSGDITKVGTDCTSGDCFVTGGTGTKLESDSNFQVEVDANNDGSSQFQILDGASASVFEVSEAGDVTATSFTADDRTSEPGNRIQINDNDTAFTNDPTCANSGSAGVLTLIDVDESSADSYAACQGTGVTNVLPPITSNLVGTLTAATSSSTAVDNTATETAFSTGSYTFSANQFAVGTTFRVSAWGQLATAAASTPTASLNLRWGSVNTDPALATITTQALVASQPAKGWSYNAICTVRSIGATGTIACGAEASIPRNATAGDGVVYPVSDLTVGTTTIDTTASTAMTLFWKWSAGASGTTSTLEGFSVEVMK